MYVRTDPLSMIYELNKQDIVIDPVKAERYIVNEVSGGHLILCPENEKRALRMITFPSLLKERSKVEIAKTVYQRSSLKNDTCELCNKDPE